MQEVINSLSDHMNLKYTRHWFTTLLGGVLRLLDQGFVLARLPGWTRAAWVQCSGLRGTFQQRNQRPELSPRSQTVPSRTGMAKKDGRLK